MPRGFKSIRTRFMFLGTTIIILLSAIYAWSSSYMTTSIVKNLISQESEITLNSHAHIIGNWLEERINEIEIYANHPIVKSGDADAIHKFLIEEQRKHHGKYVTLSFGDVAGNYQNNLSKTAGNLAEGDYFPLVMKGKSLLSDPVVSRSTGKQICVVAAPIKGVYGEIIGFFSGSIDANDLYSFIKRFQVDSKYESTYIVNQAGQIITHTNPDYIMQENIGNPSQAISKEKAKRSQEILSAQAGSFITQGTQGTQGKQMVAFQKIPHTEGWTIITEISLSSLYRPIENMHVVLVAVAVGTVLLGTMGAMIFAKGQSQPIIELTQVFERATAGDLGARANIKTQDEIGQAGQSFNMMMDTINELTYYDVLTGLPNRQSFMAKLEEKLSQDKGEGKTLAIMIVSLNKFKEINEAYGHNVGDFVLSKIARRLQKDMGPGDMVSRLLGDEFIVFLAGEETRAGVEKKTKEMLTHLNKIIMKEGHEIYPLLSIGIAFYPQDGKTAEVLIENASIAKSTAKYSEGNTNKIYHKNMRAEIQERVDISTMLYNALENGEYFLVYQPLVDIKKNEIIGAEALLRWESPHRGLVSPGLFIPLLEESGLIVRVGEWVLQEACRQNKIWQDKGLEPLVVSVNVSPVQFDREDFVDRVQEILKETRLQPQYLQLEITEGVAIQNPTIHLKKLLRLRKLGVKIAIDDFGTGYSSLSYFKDFPIHTLKIDQSFVQGIVEGEKAKAIISTIISMGQNLGLHTTAEGVETDEQLEFVKAQGCDHVQGYLFSRPIGSQDFEQYLRQSTMPTA